MMLRYKTELEIVHKVKETTKYKVVISYQIRPLNNASSLLIEYTDKTTGVSKKKILTTLKIYEDIFYLVSSINVTKDFVTLKARVSSIAEIHLRSYRTPIQISVEDLLSENNKISSKIILS
jgi:cell division protein ZapA (FtsZ GTPase activity inhibitor)